LLSTDDCAGQMFVEMEMELLVEGEYHETMFEVTGLQTFLVDSNCSETVLRGPPITVKLGLDESPLSTSYGFLGDPSGTDTQASAGGKTLVVPDDSSTSFADTPLLFDIIVDIPYQAVLLQLLRVLFFAHSILVANYGFTRELPGQCPSQSNRRYQRVGTWSRNCVFDRCQKYRKCAARKAFRDSP
jgi:hypothetical protein